MNLNCCILENESIYTNHLIELLHQWENETSCNLSIDSFASTEQLYQSTKEKYYDILRFRQKL